MNNRNKQKISSLSHLASRQSAGEALRDGLFKVIQPVLELSDRIDQSEQRLLIQASCLDMVTHLEDVIADFELDQLQDKWTG